MSPRAAFLDAMAAGVAGVTVVTAAGDRGPVGRTVSAMTSVSADPPLLLVCIRRTSPLRHLAVHSSTFAVSVLGVHQAALADRFAGRTGDHGFDERLWTPGLSGAPVLDGAAATFECALEGVTEAGTHSVLLGAVLRSRAGTAAPLAHCHRAYATAEPLRPGLAEVA
jgi:flavin reductase (DIM6/NTAB) family NADH-FMN oxidoreductase RutF